MHSKRMYSERVKQKKRATKIESEILLIKRKGHCYLCVFVSAHGHYPN